MTAHLNLPPFQSAHVLVFGDVMLDRYWYGDTDRISPEAPVPVVHIQKTTMQPGGAANVALNIAALNARVKVFGLVGEDTQAQELNTLLDKAAIQSALLAVPGCPTTTKLRVVGQHQQLIRLDFEDVFSSVDMQPLYETFASALSEAGSVVISDYAKGAVRDAAQLISMARAKNIPVLVDPKGTDYKRYAGATLVTPNLKEFTQVVGACANRDEMVGKARALIRANQIDALLVTLGKEGMLLVPQTGEPAYFPAEARDVYDVTGAGDTVIGVIAAALGAGSTLASAIALANRAAGIAVGKVGAAPVYLSELQAGLAHQAMRDSGVVSEDQLMHLMAKAHAQGQRVVMTNGCFDILHTGHIDYLTKAKALGDRLIVAVNDDDSISRLKGPTRPINTLSDRMAMLAGLGAVDWVVPFSEDTPARLIERVMPDILVKGADYTVDQIAGSAAVLENGGEVKTIPLVPNQSTSGLIAKIKAQLILA